MKKLLCLILALFLLSGITVFAEAEEIKLIPTEAAYNEGISVDASGAKGFDRGKYIGFSGVDLTGMHSVSVDCNVRLSGNGETIRVMIDSPIEGKQIASIVFDSDESLVEAYVESVSGVHDVYFVGNYGGGSYNMVIKSFTFKKEAFNDTAIDEQAPDSLIKDYYADTWVAVDDMGRKVADYPEVGAPKGNRDVGILYWIWHSGTGEKNARIISEIIKAYPDAMDNSNSEGWADAAQTYWAEPALGFYNSYEYWVYRQHFELMAAAGIDTLIFDWSNEGAVFPKAWMTCVEAMRDLKRDGVAAPKFAPFSSSPNSSAEDNKMISALYNIGFVKNDFSDVWYHVDDKPLFFGFSSSKPMRGAYNEKDKAGLQMVDDINDLFTWREFVYQSNSGWTWVESFPQFLRNADITDDGRPEFITVGMATASSYIYKGRPSGFSEPYTMSKRYSSGFGEDYSPEGPRKAWQFRDHARQALEADPHFVLVDGWNEFIAHRQANFNGLTNVFVDTFDDNNSRDFEPAKGLLKDDYYNLLVDFIRKYKGVRPAPLAGEVKTIAVDGSVSDWDSVTPEFYNYPGVDRNADSGYKYPELGMVKHFTTASSERVTNAKVSRDANNFYFYARTLEGKSINNSAIYINIDRNKATGFDGYDFAIGRNGGSAVEAIAPDGTYTYVGEATVIRNANVVEIAAGRWMFGETGVTDFEFKWITGAFTDALSLYSEANAAPIGRFNYLYTEIAQYTLNADEKAAIGDTTVLKAGFGKMVTNGGVQTVYEADLRVLPFEMNGTLYIPMETAEEILGYGRGRVEYDYTDGIFYMYNYEMNEDLTAISEKNWYCTFIGTYEGRSNGVKKTLQAPVVSGTDGRIYVPATIFYDLLGINVKNLGGGLYAIGSAADSAVYAAAAYIG